MGYFDGLTWMVYNTTYSGLPYNYVTAIAIDPDGSRWFGTEGSAAHFDSACPFRTPLSLDLRQGVIGQSATDR